MIRKIYIFFILIIVLNIFCISTAEFTGLIIDCRDLNEQLTISILPKIITKNGKLVYGTKKVPKKIIIEKGLVSYALSIEVPLVIKRTGKNPLVIKPIKIDKSDKSCIVISEKDGLKIVSANKRRHFLESAKVVIVLPK